MSAHVTRSLMCTFTSFCCPISNHIVPLSHHSRLFCLTDDLQIVVIDQKYAYSVCVCVCVCVCSGGTEHGCQRTRVSSLYRKGIDCFGSDWLHFRPSLPHHFLGSHVKRSLTHACSAVSTVYCGAHWQNVSDSFTRMNNTTTIYTAPHTTTSILGLD